MPKKDDDELVIPTELLEKDPTELANNEEKYKLLFPIYKKLVRTLGQQKKQVKELQARRQR